MPSRHGDDKLALVQMPAACEAFTFNNKANILRSMELRRTFTMHLFSLYEFGLLSPEDINKCMLLLEHQSPRS